MLANRKKGRKEFQWEASKTFQMTSDDATRSKRAKSLHAMIKVSSSQNLIMRNWLTVNLKTKDLLPLGSWKSLLKIHSFSCYAFFLCLQRIWQKMEAGIKSALQDDLVIYNFEACPLLCRHQYTVHTVAYITDKIWLSWSWRRLRKMLNVAMGRVHMP